MLKIGKINYKRRLLEKYYELIEENVINNLLESIHKYIFLNK